MCVCVCVCARVRARACSEAVLPQQPEGDEVQEYWSRVQQEHKVLLIHRVIFRKGQVAQPSTAAECEG